MASSSKNPRVLIVTPEVTYLPDRMGTIANSLTAKAGGLADVSAALINALFDQGVDVHVALPDYRAIFRDRLAPFLRKEIRQIKNRMPEDRIHLAEDRAFFYLNRVYSSYGDENVKMALAFQREVINNIIPRVQPDLIHCNDWMTGLIPALARSYEIPCLFTLHNIHTVECNMAFIEDRGIDAAEFWQHLFFRFMANDYETARASNPVDFLCSGVFAAHFVNTVSPSFLTEMASGQHAFIEDNIRYEVSQKIKAGCAVGILNAPDPAFDPQKDDFITVKYGPADHTQAKAENKKALQAYLGLEVDPAAPMFFWPSRLDPVQKGCQLLADICYPVISQYWEQNLQMVFVANGEYQTVFRDIVAHHGFHQRIAVCDFNEQLEHQSYAACDFVLMPSLFEPCGLPQMIGAVYGAMPVVHNTGGLRDTVKQLDVNSDRGNGFVFEVFDSSGLKWAIDQAVGFFNLPQAQREAQIARIMQESRAAFTYAVTASHYVKLYEKMLKRPLVVS
jgi:starch synthase/alpha-amylase